MNRNTIGEISGRSMHQAVRMTLGKVMDGPMMQEANFSGMMKDARQAVERVQSFGFSSVPLPPDQQEGGEGGGGGGGGGGKRGKAGGGGGGGGGGEGGGQGGGAPEGIALFMGGQRNHPVIIGVDDRRHRPMGLKPGENSQYDDVGQMTLMRRNGLYLLSNDNPEKEGGKETERMVSLRHVEKKKQKRGQLGQGDNSQALAKMSPAQRRRFEAAALKAEQDRQKENENTKHEGESVNTELRMTKKKIEFRNGDEVVGEHDKQSKKWNMKGKEFNANPEDAANINSKNVNIKGATGISLTGPTSVNGNPVADMTHVAMLEARIAALERALAVYL